MGTVNILNVGAGDTKLVFDKKNPQDCIRAARIVKDMLRRGFALLVEVKKGVYQRVHEFREDTCEYIIADFDPEVAATADLQEKEHGQAGEHETTASDVPSGTGKGNGRRRRGNLRRAIPAAGAKAIAVGRTAGG